MSHRWRVHDLCDPHGKAPINKASVFKVYGSAVFEGEPAMISVQLQMDPQRTERRYDRLFGTVLRDRETSPGSDQVAYVFQRLRRP
jgi:hypothetical protein